MVTSDIRFAVSAEQSISVSQHVHRSTVINFSLRRSVKWIVPLLFLTLILAFSPGKDALASGSITPLDGPGATSTDTNAQGINEAGQIVGSYSASGVTHGFLYSGGLYTTLDVDVPGTTLTLARGINDTGKIVGQYTVAGVMHGYLYDGGVFTTIDPPGASSSAARGINGVGQIVGTYTASGVSHGFLYSGGVYTTLDVDVSGTTLTSANGINEVGQIVGYYTASGVTHGFIYDGGVYTTLDVPGATRTNVYGINDVGQIVGHYSVAGVTRGFIYDGGIYTTMDVPGASGTLVNLINGTIVNGINDSGQIAGRYTDEGVNRGFIYDPNGQPTELVAAISAGSNHSCALMLDGTVQCWGAHTAGQLGNGAPSEGGRATPVTVSGISTATAIAAGSTHTCALLMDGTIKCWGQNVNGQLGIGTNIGPEACSSSGTACSTSPQSVSGINTAVSITAGPNHTCAVLSDGTVQCWGANSSGQLGDGTTSPSFTPVTVSGLSGSVTAISAGGVNSAASHTCAFSNGIVQCWGSNSSGQLGDGSTTSSSTPVTVTGLSGFVTDIDAGSLHTCVSHSTGTVKCWGANFSGQLGDGSMTNSSVPVTVSGINTATSISAGGSSGSYSHTCARLSDGAVRCWGRNIYGQLGNGITIDSSTPQTVGGIGSAIGIAAGGNHTCTRLMNGTIHCWGLNANGQLGNGIRVYSSTPLTVAGISDAASVDSGGGHVCSLSYNSTNHLVLDVPGATGMIAYGINDTGQIVGSYTAAGVTHGFLYDAGVYSTLDADVPGTTSTIAIGINDAGEIVGQYTASGVTHGFLYNGVSYTTLDVPGATTTNARAINDAGLIAGQFTASGVTHGFIYDGGVYTTIDVPGATSTIVSGINDTGLISGQYMASGLTHGFIYDGVLFTALDVPGASATFANKINDSGQVTGVYSVFGVTHGFLYNGVSYTTLDVPGAATTTARGINNAGQFVGHYSDGGGTSHGYFANNANELSADGAVQCWGYNVYGQLGNGSTVDSTPVPVSGLSGQVTAISAGLNHTCARLSDGTIQCWGYNAYGQLGDWETTNSSTPVTVTGLGGQATAISAGGIHTCAVLSDGNVQCWGANSFGQLGDGTWTSSSVPVTVTGLSGPVTAISAGSNHTCARLSDGTVQCWGYNASGQLGNGTTSPSPLPLTVTGLSTVTTISAGNSHTCARLSDGTVRCWGANTSGQLGDGTRTSSSVPVTVTGLSGSVTAISNAGSFTCARISDGTVQCWGTNTFGEIGNGSTVASSTPVTVSGINTALSISAGTGGHNCAFLSDGTVQCWGRNHRGQLGDGRAGISTTPVQVIGLGSDLDTDNDGLPDSWENDNGLDPNDPSDASIDSDGDGFSNIEELIGGTNPQNNSTAPNSGTVVNNQSETIRLVVSQGETITDLQWVDPVSLPSPPPVEFPFGLVSFDITVQNPGDTVTIALTFPASVSTSTVYYKYGPTVDNPADHWYSFPIGSNDGDNTITLTLTDGGPGDHDLAANGVIVDPGGTSIAESCNGIDTDGDGEIDEIIISTYYRDVDGDSFGNVSVTAEACAPPPGYVSNNDDCDDSNASINPGAVEVCGNGEDDNCNGQTDEGNDQDGDGFTTCAGDCNDNNASVYPGATEVCNGVDDNCNAQVDEGNDQDGDGITTCAGDCNDGNASIHPGAAEVCNAADDNCNSVVDEGVLNACGLCGSVPVEICDGFDNDCDGSVDDGLMFSSYYNDLDGDMYGDLSSGILACSLPAGRVSDSTDCNDADPTIYPGATEIPGDGIDQDCDGVDSVTASRLGNISTRGMVQTGDRVMIGGFIISGSAPRSVLIRGFGPTLADFGVTGAMANPYIELYSGQTMIATNDNWQTPIAQCDAPAVSCGTPQDIQDTGKSACSVATTGCSQDAAILVTLPPGAYTAIMRGVGGGTGVGLVGVDDNDTNPLSKLVNISTRGPVLTGDSVMIGGFIVGGSSSKTVLIRGFGPTLADFGVSGALADPYIELYSGQTMIATNDNWQVQQTPPVGNCDICRTPEEIEATGKAACTVATTGCNLDAALLVTLPPGAYTAIMRGVGGTTGVGLVGIDEIGP